MFLYIMCFCSFGKDVCKDNANRMQNIKSHLNVMLRCSLSYAKIMQTECRTSSLLECYAEVQLILCKDNTLYQTANGSWGKLILIVLICPMIWIIMTCVCAFSNLSFACQVEEACDAVADAAVFVVDKGIEKSHGTSGWYHVVVGDGCGNQATVALAQCRLASCLPYPYAAVALDACGDNEAVIFEQVAVERLRYLCHPYAEER